MTSDVRRASAVVAVADRRSSVKAPIVFTPGCFGVPHDN